MDTLVSSIGVGIVVFTSTNIDDIFIVSALFADRRLARRSIVIGQFTGIGTLILVSVAAALLAVAVPKAWVAMLGFFPLLLGIARLLTLNRDEPGEVDPNGIRNVELLTERRLHSQSLAVAAVTIANGGDNLAVYIPLFASAPSAIVVHVAVFAIMTGLLCVAGYVLVDNDRAAGIVRRYGHVALPVVLIGLGFYILSDAVVLLR